MKKAHSTSQTMGSAKPARAWRGVITLKSAMAQTPRKTTAPGGMGRAIDPTIVAVKMASSRHDSTVMPLGRGMARTKAAAPSTANHRMALGLTALPWSGRWRGLPKGRAPWPW